MFRIACNLSSLAHFLSSVIGEESGSRFRFGVTYHVFGAQGFEFLCSVKCDLQTRQEQMQQLPHIVEATSPLMVVCR